MPTPGSRARPQLPAAAWQIDKIFFNPVSREAGATKDAPGFHQITGTDFVASESDSSVSVLSLIDVDGDGDLDMSRCASNLHPLAGSVR